MAPSHKATASSLHGLQNKHLAGTASDTRSTMTSPVPVKREARGVRPVFQFFLSTKLGFLLWICNIKEEKTAPSCVALCSVWTRPFRTTECWERLSQLPPPSHSRCARDASEAIVALPAPPRLSSHRKVRVENCLLSPANPRDPQTPWFLKPPCGAVCYKK